MRVSLSSWRTGVSIRFVILCLLVAAVAGPTTGSAATTDDHFDAIVLALEADGPGGVIRADPALVADIEADLASIRTQQPDLADIHVLPTWVPGRIAVKLTPAAYAAVEAGTYTGFDALFALYPPDEMTTWPEAQWVTIGFVEPLHSGNLAGLFAELDDVLIAEADGIGGDGDDIIRHDASWYTFKHGWGDCPAGCILNHYWDVHLQGDTAVVEDEWGDTVQTTSSTWSRLKASYR